MKTKKQDVIEFLVNLPEKESEKFNKAFELYRNSDGKNFSQERFLNKVGFSTTSMATVFYELKKIHKISDSEIRNAFKELEASGKPVQKTIEDLITLLLQLPEEDKNDILLSYKINSELASEENPLSKKLSDLVEEGRGKFAIFIKSHEEDYSWMNGNEESENELLAALDKITAEFEFPEELKEEIEAYSTLNIKVIQPVFVNSSAEVHRDGGVTIKGTINQEETKKEADNAAVFYAFENAQPEVKEAIKFRDEFPFLKDDDCPSELKALVTDKFTAYYEFCDAHQELFEKVVAPVAGEKLADNAIIFELAKKAVDNFLVDQTIYDELTYYKDENKILGKHPVFAKIKLQEQVEKLSIADAAKRAANLDNYIRRDTNKAEAAKTPEENEKFLQKVEAWKLELHYIKIKLEK